MGRRRKKKRRKHRRELSASDPIGQKTGPSSDSVDDTSADGGFVDSTKSARAKDADGDDSARHDGDDSARHDGDDSARHDGDDSARHDGDDSARHDGDDSARHDGDNGARHDGDDSARHDGDDSARHDGDDSARHDGDNGARHDGDNGARHDGVIGLEENPHRESLDARLLPYLEDDEEIVVRLDGMAPAGPAVFLLTQARFIYFQACEFGLEVGEIRYKRRPSAKLLPESGCISILVSDEMRRFKLRGLNEATAAKFARILDEIVESSQGPADSWETMTADDNLWDEMRLYLGPEQDPFEDSDKEADDDDSSDSDFEALQQEWIKKGALRNSGDWWPPTAATLVWCIPALLLVWILHSIFILSNNGLHGAPDVEQLMKAAQNGDTAATGRLAMLLSKEQDYDRKMAIARLLAKNSPPGAGEFLLQDIFSHDDSTIRQVEIQGLLSLNFGRELVARLSQPGPLDLKIELLDELGEFGDRSIARSLEELYPALQSELHPVLFLTMARLDNYRFLVRCYETGAVKTRELCLTAIGQLEPGHRETSLKKCRNVERYPFLLKRIARMLGETGNTASNAKAGLTTADADTATTTTTTATATTTTDGTTSPEEASGKAMDKR